jgi:hypothetical protein
VHFARRRNPRHSEPTDFDGDGAGWLLLAEQADKNSHLDPTYATSQLRPPQPACTSTVAQQQQQQQQRLVEPEQDTEEK